VLIGKRIKRVKTFVIGAVRNNAFEIFCAKSLRRGVHPIMRPGSGVFEGILPLFTPRCAALAAPLVTIFRCARTMRVQNPLEDLARGAATETLV
jgi:hypothetical protein